MHLQADETKLTQIVTNLLTNAVKYTPSGGRIRLSAQGDGERGEVQVLVRDTGIGIPSAQIHRIFDMFAALRMGTRSAVAGWGSDSHCRVSWRLCTAAASLRIAMGRDSAQSSCLRCRSNGGSASTINLRSAPPLSVLEA